VAYAGFWIEGKEAHIAKVAVHPTHRRRGIASAMLERLVDHARRLGIPKAYLEVRKSNLAAQELYRRLGFRFERLQPRAYPDNGEDALVFARDGLLETRARSKIFEEPRNDGTDAHTD
jgi:ribosomal-protein-alanine N-acetyltransferase